MPGRYFCFCSSLPAIITGPVGSRVSSSMSAAVFEYLATSSMAMVSPRMPAPDPPYSSGMHSPSRPASRNSLEEVLGVLAGVVDLAGARLDLVLGEPANRLLELRSSSREVEIHARTLPGAAIRRTCGAGGSCGGAHARWRRPRRPSRSRFASAYSRHASRTGQAAQIALAVVGILIRDGVKDVGIEAAARRLDLARKW